MKILYPFLMLFVVAFASLGDNLPEFQSCLYQCDCNVIPQSIFWSCPANCNYYCQQLITDQLESLNVPMVQFYGKWPFKRVLGVQEFFAMIFSIGNLYVNYKNLRIIYRQFKRNESEYKTMYVQYLILLIVTCIGWSFSVIFHFKDTTMSETLDYFGAFAIILCNLNAIVVRVFQLFKHRKKLIIWHTALVALYLYHVIRLKRNWDYSYNTLINIIVGVSAMILWCFHLWRVYCVYNQKRIIYNNSIQLLPYETKLLQKLSYVGMSLSSLIPLIPIFNNVMLLLGISLELNDFPPIARLVDAHALWHLVTIFPSIVWFDWNVWDIEMLKITNNSETKV